MGSSLKMNDFFDTNHSDSWGSILQVGRSWLTEACTILFRYWAGTSVNPGGNWDEPVGAPLAAALVDGTRGALFCSVTVLAWLILLATTGRTFGLENKISVCDEQLVALAVKLQDALFWPRRWNISLWCEQLRKSGDWVPVHEPVNQWELQRYPKSKVTFRITRS